ncbi:MAG: response regulator transcription factor [Planctomycetes bacterium]|nr:response regulator transcription factor [Planctomycetota bacterium]
MEKYSIQNGNRTRAPFFPRPPTNLFNDSQWSYIQQLYRMGNRELQVARLVCQGLNNKEVADRLQIKHGTVKTHMRNIYRRLRVKNKIAMLLMLMEAVGTLPSGGHATPSIPIVEVKNQDKQTSAPSNVPEKHKPHTKSNRI